MNQDESFKFLKEGFWEFGISLTEEKFQKLMRYKEMVIEFNKFVNLTSIVDDKEFLLKHFIDSLSILPYIKKYDKNIIDVGTGAGFPGIPIKIMIPKIDVTLLDSLQKRIKFLDNSINELKLSGIRAIHSRAEDKGIDRDFRERYSYAVARAVAPLSVLLEYCLPFLKVGGSFFAMKARLGDEVVESKSALNILGGEIEEIHDIKLPFADITRNIVIVKKIKKTHSKFPRKSGTPNKDPIM